MIIVYILLLCYIGTWVSILISARNAPEVDAEENYIMPYKKNVQESAVNETRSSVNTL
jgi:hypothetical protein